METKLISRKRKYTTDTIFRYRQGILDEAIIKQIPKTTLQYWNKLSLNEYFGYTALELSFYKEAQHYTLFAQHKRIGEIAKILAIIVFFNRQIISICREKKLLFRSQAKELFNVVARAIRYISLKTVLRWLGLSYQQYYSITNYSNCTHSIIGYCRKRHPFQLTEKESATIRAYLVNEHLKNLSAASLYCRMLRDNAARMSISTFYKYQKLLNLVRAKLYKRDRHNYIPIQTKQPKQILHIDVTVFRTKDNVKAYLYVIQDNFSRAILGMKAALTANAAIALANLKEVIEKYMLEKEPLLLITDDGSENHGEVSRYIETKSPLLKRQIAQLDIIQSNSMIEAANKKLKYQFLYQYDINDFEHLQKLLPDIQQQFNEIPLLSLSAYTPNEVMAGKIPDKKRFAAEINKAAHTRKQHNRQFNCTDVCKAAKTGTF